MARQPAHGYRRGACLPPLLHPALCSLIAIILASDRFPEVLECSPDAGVPKGKTVLKGADYDSAEAKPTPSEL